MEKLENSNDVDHLYIQFCKMLKKYSSDSIPTKGKFILTLKAFNSLVEGHKLLLTAIGKL